MTATPAELLRELDAIGDAAPWSVLYGMNVVAARDGCKDVHVLSSVSNKHEGWADRNHDNAALIVTLRNALPLLAAYAEAADALLKAIDDLDAENGDRNLFVSPGCLICTDGTTPDRYNTGLCAYHSAKAAREALVRALQEGQ